MPLPDDHFDQWFTNRASELEEWQNALDAPKGEAPASRVFIGVTGAGKTFLRRRFARLAEKARVACVTVELADDKGGSQQVDPAVLAHRVAREMGIECPRTELALLRIAALESGSQVVEQQLAAELAADTLGSAFDALLEQFHSFSLGGVVATFLKHGYQKFKQGQQALQQYLKTEDGADDRSWVLGQKEPSDLRLDLFRRLAEDLAAGPPRKESAVQAVVLFDSGEHGGPKLPVLDRLLRKVPGVLAVLFGQQDIESTVKLQRENLDGFLRHDAEQYCTEKRGVPAVQVEGILAEAHEEGGRYHVYSLGLLCDAALDGKGPLAAHEDDEAKSRTEALSKRFLARQSEEDRGFLRRLALLPDFDEDAACHACATGPDAERRGAKMRWLQGFSFVQPAGEGRWRLHAVMRRVLAETSEPEDNLRRHREWREHWQGRSESPTDEAAARAWYHQFALGLSEAMADWKGVAEEALRNARTAEHAWLVDLARPLVSGDVLGGAPATPELRDAAQHDWAIELQQVALGDTRAQLEEAATAFRAALGVYTREAFPAQWATTQNNLGIALQTLGEREEGTARLEEAAAAYRAALEVRTREAFPAQWATTQNNLGVALRALGGREEGTARLEEAADALRAALEVRTREDFPAQWATTQNNLGNALSILGGREEGTARLEEAAAAYRAALEVRTREAFPADWAMTQNNLGIALQTLGEREEGTARLEEAARAYRAALEVYSRGAFPAQWATTQNNLGNALQLLGMREGNAARLDEAVAACRAALEVWTREAFPAGWATTQNNLGNALRALGGREEGTARLEEAVAAFRDALEVCTAENFPHHHAGASRNLVRALALLAERGG